MGEEWAQVRLKAQNIPCIFPIKQGILTETGSQQTASTARYKETTLAVVSLYLIEGSCDASTAPHGPKKMVYTSLKVRGRLKL